MTRTPRAARGARRAAARACAVSAALACVLGCGGPSRKLDEATTLEREQRPREALALYQAALGELGDGPMDGDAAQLRLSAIRRAADIAYLQTGDYPAAVAYYRRVVALAPGTPEARAARVTIAEIYRERFKDPQGAIAQWAAIAQEGGPAGAAPGQLQVARLYLEAGDPGQARTEARILREKWPQAPEAAEAQLVTVQAFAQERKVEDAVRAAEAASAAWPARPATARALETVATLLAQDGRLERAEALYARAVAGHPNPQAVETSLAAVRRRREAKGVARPGDRAAALDHHLPKQKEHQHP
ncbi:MAG: tetratricopeptide repeat protein [Anaeromyxobacteraceae bacterium]